MYPAFQLSQNVQEMRIHFWALKREDLNIPENIQESEGWSKIDQLTRLVLEHDLDRSNFSYELDFSWDESCYIIRLSDTSTFDSMYADGFEFEATYFPPPRRERPEIRLYLYNNGLWCLDQQLHEVQGDLAIYEQAICAYNNFKKQAPAPKLPADELKRELTRNITWVKQVNKCRTTLDAQRNNLTELMNVSMESLPSGEGPVRVEVEEGQSLSEAIFLALHNQS